MALTGKQWRQAGAMLAKRDVSGLKRLLAHGTTSEKTTLRNWIKQASSGKGTTTAGQPSDVTGDFDAMIRSGMKLVGVDNMLAIAALDVADSVGKMGGAFFNAKTGAAKLEVLIKGLGGALNGLIKFIDPVIGNIEKYRIGLVRVGVKDGPRFLKSLSKQARGMYQYGVSLQTVVEAQEGFRNNLAMLTTTGYPRSAKALTRMAAINHRFGISLSESTVMINKMNIGFNATTQQTDKISRQLLKFARETGQPFSKVWADFNGGIEKFMFNMDPDKALQKFTIFQRLAREMGGTVGGLVDIVDKFDDLETGMQYGGELNMLLSSMGGSFDAVQATLMSQPERMKYIADQLQEVGGRIEGMSELGQRAVLKQVASTTGLDIGVIKSILQKDVGADVGKYMKNANALGAMNRSQQKDLAQQQTSREERLQQQNDLMINNITIKMEELRMKGQMAMTKVFIDQVPKLTRKLEEVGLGRILDAASKSLTEFNAATATNASKFETKMITAFATPVKNLTDAMTGGATGGKGLTGEIQTLNSAIAAQTRAPVVNIFTNQWGSFSLDQDAMAALQGALDPTMSHNRPAGGGG